MIHEMRFFPFRIQSVQVEITASMSRATAREDAVEVSHGSEWHGTLDTDSHTNLKLYALENYQEADLLGSIGHELVLQFVEVKH